VTGLQVAHVISSFRPIIGGAEKATETLARGLLAQGVGVRIITRHHVGLVRHEEVDGIPIWRVGQSRIWRNSSVTFMMQALVSLAKWGDAWPIVHVQNVDAPLLVGYAARMWLRKPLVVTIQARQDMILRKRVGLGKMWVRFMGRVGDRFVAVTPDVREQYVRDGVSPDRIADIPNAVDTTRFAPVSPTRRRELRRRLGLDEAVPVVLFVGRLVALKSVDTLLRAVAVLQAPVQVVIVGEGPEGPRWAALAKDLNIDGAVWFVGAMQDPLQFYQLADVFVLPSRYEGLSVALLEAMSSGLVPIASDIAGNRSVVQAERTGYLFPVGKVESLATYLESLVTQEDVRLKMATRARAFMEENYAVPVVVQHHINLYRSLLDMNT